MERRQGQHDTRSLERLLVELEGSEPSRRIDFREPILGYGSECIGPLVDLVARRSNLAASAAAWLEVLVLRDPETRPSAMKALGVLARGQDGHIAREALGRLGAPSPMASKPGHAGTHTRNPSELRVHARVIAAAREGRILWYSQLETGRGQIGQYLRNIAEAEAELGHPPLTAIVVSKSTGLPGDGFMQAMIDVGFAHRGEAIEVVWKRAVAAVHAFWMSQPG